MRRITVPVRHAGPMRNPLASFICAVTGRHAAVAAAKYACTVLLDLDIRLADADRAAARGRAAGQGPAAHG